MLYKKSGLLGISGISNDMRDLLRRSRASRARLAVDYFVYRAAKEIGALAAALTRDRRPGASPPASARTRRRSAARICDASCLARHRARTRRPTRNKDRADLVLPGSRVSVVGDSDQRKN